MAAHRLVIARYAEQLGWLTQVPDSFGILVTNKGAPVTDPQILARARIIERPNAGREGETYLAHIAASQAQGAPGYTVFAQGDPFEHSPDFLALLGQTEAWADVQPLSWRWKVARDIPPAAILARETGDFVAGLRVRPEPFSLASWAPLGFDDPGTQWLNATYRRLHRLPEGTNIAAHFLAMCGLESLARAAGSHLLGRFAYGAVFAVRTARLGDVPGRALDRLREATVAHSVYGYVLERLWLHLFGAPFAMPLTVALPAAVSSAQTAFLPPETAAAMRGRKAAHLARRALRVVAGG